MKVAINGFGRIGRAILKLTLDTPGLETVAINDIASPENLSYLLKYDTVYGRYDRAVSIDQGVLRVGDERIKVLAERDPSGLPWQQMGVDLVFECTGIFRTTDDLSLHLKAGAKHALLSAPSKSDEMITVVHGTSQEERPAAYSCASCTTNCITPVAEVMQRRFGVRKAIMSTIHAYTASQGIIDGPSKNFRRGRAGGCNFVPTTTGAAIATAKVLPELASKFDGVAVRAPIPCGSIADLVFVTEKSTSVEEVNAAFVAESESERYMGVLGVSDEPLVSSDILRDPRASIVDLEMTKVVDDDLVKVMAWYDNEWGYASQMVREAAMLATMA